ncbi:hypothetical protein HY68_05245 [Streptomyces sp. AcH 505]|nr:hypothetical protein HY68_05245 [Streptomyces sp. AcH 505]
MAGYCGSDQGAATLGEQTGLLLVASSQFVVMLSHLFHLAGQSPLLVSVCRPPEVEVREVFHTQCRLCCVTARRVEGLTHEVSRLDPADEQAGINVMPNPQ